MAAKVYGTLVELSRSERARLLAESRHTSGRRKNEN